MAYYLYDVLREALQRQNQDAYDIRIATSGSTTTFVDTTLLDKYEDDELLDGWILVVRTTDNLAPVGEFSRITAYSQESYTATFGALSATIDAGDTVMLVSSEYSLYTMIEKVNTALMELGEITLIDTNTTTVAGALEYTLALNFKNLIDIYVETITNDADNHGWQRVDVKRVVPSPTGTDTVVVLQYVLPEDRTLQIIYNGYHGRVYAFDDPIDSAIQPPLLNKMVALKIMEWYGVTDENRDEANKLLAEIEEAQRLFPVRRLPDKQNPLLIWGNYDESDTFTVPGAP